MDSKTFNSLAITLFLFAVSFQFTGCGNDSVVNNNNGVNGTLLFSMDSLAINLPNDSMFTNDTTLSILNSENIRLEFTSSSNADSVSSFASFTIKADYIDSNNVYHVYIDTTQNIISQLNNSYSFNINGGVQFGLFLKVQLFRNLPVFCYIRLRNIKVFKV